MKVFELRCARERGATAIEYALVIGLVSLATVAATVTLGDRFVTWATAVADTIGTMMS